MRIAISLIFVSRRKKNRFQLNSIYIHIQIYTFCVQISCVYYYYIRERRTHRKCSYEKRCTTTKTMMIASINLKHKNCAQIKFFENKIKYSNVEMFEKAKCFVYSIKQQQRSAATAAAAAAEKNFFFYLFETCLIAFKGEVCICARNYC